MGYRLRIVSGPGTGTDRALDVDELTIGRAPENGIVINDNNVSRVHARVTVEGGRVLVADAGSRNGVYVNDRKVAQQPLAPGDRVVIGQSVMELVADGRKGGAALQAGGRGAPQLRPGGRLPAPRSGAMARTTPATKGRQGGLGLAALFGVVVVAALFLAFSVGNSHRPPTPGSTSPASAGVHPHPTPPQVFAGTGGAINPGTSSSVQKCNKAAKEWLDVGDSNMVSSNLTKSCEAFKQAKRADRFCASADARLQVAQDKVRSKVLEYERAGQLQYDSGDYQGAIDRWKIAKEFILGCIGEPNDPRVADLSTKVDQAGKLIRKQPQ